MLDVIVFACFCMSVLWGLLTLAVRYILTLWYGISHSMGWERHGKSREERRERRGLGFLKYTLESLKQRCSIQEKITKIDNNINKT